MKQNTALLILMTLIATVTACSGKNSTTNTNYNYNYKDGYIIEDESLINKLLVLDTHDIQVYAWGVGTDTIRIRALKSGIDFTGSPFLLTILSSGIVPEDTASGKKIGRYEIRALASGYELYINDIFMYKSTFVATGSAIIETRETNKSGDPDEFFMGMGQSSSDIIKDNATYEVYHSPEYGGFTHMYVPFIFSSTGNAFYYNASARDQVSFASAGTGTFTYSSDSGFIDSYYYQKNTPKELVSKFYSMTGSKSLIPKWAFGYIQSKYGYRSTSEVLALVDEFEARSIPLSAVVLDLYWFTTMGDFDWDYSAWNPKVMNDTLEAKGIKTISITEPYVLETSKNFNFLKNAHSLTEDSSGRVAQVSIWLGSGGMINPISKSALETVGTRYADFITQGIDGFWTDLGEPEVDAPGGVFDIYSMDYFHNYYNREWSRLIFNAMNKSHPNHRLFNLSRSGYTGSAGYGVSHWSGDIQSSFYSLYQQISFGINDGIAGFSYWGNDTGGFIGNPDEELAVRWFQFSTFTPVFRAHSANPREPWNVAAGTNYDTIVKYIKLRYKLLPYSYSTAWQTYSSGTPMMRSMNLEFPSDGSFFSTNSSYLSSQFMFGDSLLVAPITSSGAVSRNVYLPESKWYSLHDYKEHSPGIKAIPVTIADIPVFIRNGSILPWDEDMNGEAETFYVFPKGSETSFIWYNDDGVSNNFKTGNYEAITITSTSTSTVRFDDVTTAKNGLTLHILTNTSGTTFADSFTTIHNVSLAAGNNTITY